MSKKRKHVCVVGLGRFGTALASALAETCEVLAIDRDEAAVNAISDKVQHALVLDARDPASLGSAVTGDFDEAVVSLGGSMEASILCTLHLKRLGVASIRAKAVNDDHATILEAVGATRVFFPERETARRVAAQIAHPNLLDFVPLEEDYRVMEIAPPELFVGKTLKDLQIRNRFGVFVIAIKEIVPPRFVFLPDPAFTVKPSDILVVIGREKDLSKVLGVS